MSIELIKIFEKTKDIWFKDESLNKQIYIINELIYDYLYPEKKITLKPDKIYWDNNNVSYIILTKTLQNLTEYKILDKNFNYLNNKIFALINDSALELPFINHKIIEVQDITSTKKYLNKMLNILDAKLSFNIFSNNIKIQYKINNLIFKIKELLISIDFSSSLYTDKKPYIKNIKWENKQCFIETLDEIDLKLIEKIKHEIMLAGDMILEFDTKEINSLLNIIEHKNAVIKKLENI